MNEKDKNNNEWKEHELSWSEWEMSDELKQFVFADIVLQRCMFGKKVREGWGHLGKQKKIMTIYGTKKKICQINQHIWPTRVTNEENGNEERKKGRKEKNDYNILITVSLQTILEIKAQVKQKIMLKVKDSEHWIKTTN